MTGPKAAQHTQGPWEVVSGTTIEAQDHRGRGIWIGTVDSRGANDSFEDKANAARIVACVNACEGIPNEQLEREGVRRTKLGALRLERDEAVAGEATATECYLEVCKQRDELAAALRRLVERCDGAAGVRADGSNIDTADAHGVLAKVQP